MKNDPRETSALTPAAATPVARPPGGPAGPLSAADAFFSLARSKLDFAVPEALTDPSRPATRGDLDLDPELWEKAGVIAARPAAVLVPVVDRPEPGIILTQRTTSLPSHAGQIAFPGGKIDPEDESPLAAALREADEEVGLDRKLIEPIGYLDLFCTFSGFRILPLVARVDPGYVLTLNPAEVEDAFEVPLAFLMNVENHALQSRDWKGVLRRFYAMPWRDRYIWGVTAGILRNLYERVYER
ncbi:putative nudix hydrolase YeaB [Rhodovulum sp. PH10]|uniref:CoA pyrophosphatase n=1 Tax=Rhodovulum sp. PH10 TaxID=1187851 RepID=UPI00027C2CE7|nr:CoA pyrophosphatase [Rhodovulum sp. PH10]EJW11581.1 putative nudix hydrolase YeaB [Rhodovulum sp. PH10]